MKLLQDLAQIPAGITIIGFDPNRSSIMMSTIDLFSTKGITTFWCSPESDFLCGMFKVRQCPTILVLNDNKEIFRRTGAISYSELQEIIQ